MMFFLGCLILTIIAVMLGAPFVEDLAPSDNIILFDTDKGKTIAEGAETLWYQWQSWGYLLIGVCIVTICFGLLWNIIDGWMKTNNDEDLQKDKKHYQQLISEQEKWRDEQTHAIREDINREVQNERDELDHLQNQLFDLKKSLEHQQTDIEEKERRVRHIQAVAAQQQQDTKLEIQKNQKVIRSQLAQRDRLSEEKKQLIQFLDDAGWTYQDGSQITYQSLLKQAKRYLRK